MTEEVQTLYFTDKLVQKSLLEDGGCNVYKL
jgi:hypothetical protein